MKTLWVFLWLGLVCSCSYDRFDDPELEAEPLPVPNMDLGTLRSLYPGYSVAISGSGIVLSGCVTTSDEASNFYRSFIMEDLSGAVEVRIGLYELYPEYGPGRQIVVEADGLTLGMDDGVLQLGLASDRYATEYMEHRAVIEQYVHRGERLDPIQPRWVEPADLRPEWCGMLIGVKNLYLDEAADTTWALPARMTSTGVARSVSLKFRTQPQDSLYVFTSGYADFAGERVPRGPISVQGILMRGEVDGREVYQLKMRDLNDVQKGSD